MLSTLGKVCYFLRRLDIFKSLLVFKDEFLTTYGYGGGGGWRGTRKSLLDLTRTFGISGSFSGEGVGWFGEEKGEIEKFGDRAELAMAPGKITEVETNLLETLESVKATRGWELRMCFLLSIVVCGGGRTMH